MFSIVIPYFNIGESLLKTIASLESQTYKEFEVIIIDDGSEKPLRLSEISTNLNIKIINTPNQGVSIARNLGASLAKKSYLIFLDAGDFYKADFLKIMKCAIHSNPGFDLFGTAFSFSKRDEETTAITDVILPELSFSYEEYIKHICENNYLFHLCSVVLSKEIFFKVGGFTPMSTHGEDHELILKMLKESSKCYFVNKPLFCYSLDDDNSVTRRKKFIPTYAHSNYLLSIKNRSKYEGVYLVHTLVDNFLVNIMKGFPVKGMRQIVSDLPILLYTDFTCALFKKMYFYAKK